MKIFHRLFLLPSLVLLIALAVKLTGWPNQLLLVAGALLLVFVFLVVFSAQAIRQAGGAAPKIKHGLCFVLSFVLVVLPYAGMFQQGPLPLLVYMAIFSIVVAYFYAGKGVNPSKPYRLFVFLNLILVILNSPFTSVLPDKFYLPAFAPRYDEGKGPEIFIDEAHNNYHTSTGLYTTFSNILKKDGYVVRPFADRFSHESLKKIKLLVIANALNKKNVHAWNRPVYPAFDGQEIQSIKTWVTNGGALFLIADHPPFSSAARSLGLAFGFEFFDCTAKQRVRSGPDLFCRLNKMLAENEITTGGHPFEHVDSIVSFTGQAFKIPDSATSILRFNAGYAGFIQNDRSGKTMDITGLSQGAYMQYGKGRLVVFGEAAMFSGQLGAGLSWIKIGLNSPRAKNNHQLLLNLIHWLDGK